VRGRHRRCMRYRSRCTPQKVGTDQKIAGIFPGSRREGSGGEQGKRPALNRRLARQTLAHGGQVQIRAFCALHLLVLSREASRSRESFSCRALRLVPLA